LLGIHHSSLSLWLQNKIKGQQVKIAEHVETYLENFLSNKPRINSSHISKLSMLKAAAQASANEKMQLTTEEPTNLEELPRPENDFGSLVPIKLDLEIDGKRLKEVFLWDKNEPYLTVESFVKILMEENNLSQGQETDIIQQMKR